MQVVTTVYNDWIGGPDVPDGPRPAGPLLGHDYTHPSAAGHRVFARLLGRVDTGVLDEG